MGRNEMQNRDFRVPHFGTTASRPSLWVLHSLVLAGKRRRLIPIAVVQHEGTQEGR